MQISSDRSFEFDAPPAEVWAAIADVADYQRRWPWLRQFDAAALATGEVWTCVVQPPVPYALRFHIHLLEVAEGRAEALLDGDLAGVAHLEVQDHPPGCTVRLASRLAPRNAVLSAVARLAPPMARYGHDWVLDTGARQFGHELDADDR